MRELVITDTHKLVTCCTDTRAAEIIHREIELAKKKKPKFYHSKEIQQKAKVLPMQIKHWTNSGVIIPHEIVRGTGRAHSYSHQNLLEATICRELNHFSMNINVMKDVLGFLRDKVSCFRLRIDTGQLSLFDAIDIQEHKRDLCSFFSNMPDCKSREDIIIELTDSTRHNRRKVHEIINSESKPIRSALLKWLWEYEEFRDKIDSQVQINFLKYLNSQSKYIDLYENLTIWDYLKFYPKTDHFFLMLWTKSKGINGAHVLPSGMRIHVTIDQMDEIMSRCKSLITINISDLLEEAGDFYEEVKY